MTSHPKQKLSRNILPGFSEYDATDDDTEGASYEPVRALRFATDTESYTLLDQHTTFGGFSASHDAVFEATRHETNLP